MEQLRKDVTEIENKIKTCEAALKSYDEQTGNCKNILQSLMPHQAMLDQYGLVLEKIRSYGSLLSESDTMKKGRKRLTQNLRR